MSDENIHEFKKKPSFSHREGIEGQISASYLVADDTYYHHQGSSIAVFLLQESPIYSEPAIFIGIRNELDRDRDRGYGFSLEQAKDFIRVMQSYINEIEGKV